MVLDQDEQDPKTPLIEVPLIMLSTINAIGFVGAFCEIFEMSQKFS